MSILAAERQQQILERLGRDGRVLAAALAQAFSTSEDTIRRDLRDLAERAGFPGFDLYSSPRRGGDRPQGGAGPGVGRPCRARVVHFHRFGLDQPRRGEGFSRRPSGDGSDP